MISKKYLSFALIFILLLIIPASATERLCDVSFEDCRASLIQLINQETVGLDVAFWFMDDTTIASAVINKAKTVPVRILMDPRSTATKPGNGPVLNSLQAAGIPMRQRLTSGILHWKTMIFAGQGIVEFSGANFSRSEYLPYTPYVNYTDEAIYFSDDPAIFNSFRTKYDDWWTDTASYTNYANISTSLARAYATYPIDPSLDLLPVTGSNAWQYDYGTRSITAMNAEKVKLDIDMFRVTNTTITDNTIKLFTNGLPIRMIIDQSEYRDPTRVWNSYNMDRLFMAGIPMKITVHQGQNHEKVLLLYGQGETIFGSSNWSFQSFNKQQEHNIFTKKPWFFQWFVNQFERRWDSNTEYAAFVPLGPGTPTYVSPATASAGQSLNPTLTWNGGRFAQTYDVYFGTTSNPPMIATSVVGGTPTNAPATQPNSLYKMAALTPGTTYYWKIVSKTAAGVTAAGPVWSFTTTTTPPVGGATVTSVTPNTGADSGGTAVTISGTNFGASPKVSFGNILASKIVLVNNTTITAVTPPHVGGAADVTVSSAGGCGTLPAGYSYTTTPVNTALQVNLVSPTTGSPTGGDSITITGNNILSGAKVTFGGVAATVTGTGKNAIHVTTPAGSSGPVDVVLTNPNGQFVTVKGGFTYTNPAGPPNVSSVSPNSGSLNGGSSLTINGSGFAFGAVVTIGGNTATTITVMPGGNVITATAPAHAIGLADVVVTNRDGQTSTLSGSYNYTTAPAPSISSVAPSAGTVNGGAGVTISGANFVYGASVTIGGRPAMVQTVTGTYINAVTPTGRSTGASDVIVTNPDGQSQTLTGGYTYQ